MTKHSRMLSKFEVGGIPPAPRRQPQIEVTFEIDSNGMLKVGTVDKEEIIKLQLAELTKKSQKTQSLEAGGLQAQKPAYKPNDPHEAPHAAPQSPETGGLTEETEQASSDDDEDQNFDPESLEAWQKKFG